MGMRAGLLVLVLLALGGCRSKAPPPQALVDEDRRFEIAWPGPGWQLLDAREARAIVPDAVAGARGSKAVHGAVIVETLDPPDLEAVARQIADNLGVRDKKLGPFNRLDYVGKKAIRWGTTGTVNGMAVRFEHTVFVHQRHLYQVLAFSVGDLARADGSDFRPFTDAFSLLPGEVRDRVQAVRVADAAGVGWRVKGGVYESAAHGVRVSPRPGWHVSVGAELARMNASAEFGLSRASPQAFIVALAERAPPAAARAAYVRGIVGRTVHAVNGKVEAPARRISVAGVEVNMTAYSTGGPLPLHYLHGVLFHGREAIQLVAWTPTAEAAAGLPAITEGLAGIELHDEAARAQLRRELSGKPDPRSQVGPAFSFRRDVYRDFGRGFSFRRSGLWRVTTGDRARDQNERAVLWLDEPALGLLAYLSVTPTDAAAEAAHRQEVGTRLMEPAGPQPVQLGGTPALRSVGLIQSDAVKLQWEVNTLVRAGRLYAVNVWGQPADLAGARDEIERVLAAFRFEEPEAPGLHAGRYQDQRLGFAYQPPGGAWQTKDLTPPGVAADMHLVGWTRARREIVVGALGINDQSPGAALKGMEARMRSMLGDQLEREPGTLAGHPCQRSRGRKGITRLEMHLLERDGIAYMVIASAPMIGYGAFFDEAAAGFTLLD